MYERRIGYSDNFISRILRDFYKSKQVEGLSKKAAESKHSDMSKKLNSKEFDWLLESSNFIDELDMLYKQLSSELKQIDQLLREFEGLDKKKNLNESINKILDFIKHHEAEANFTHNELSHSVDYLFAIKERFNRTKEALQRIR